MRPAFDEDAGWEIEAVLAWHDDDAKAAVGALLADIHHLRHQLKLASLAMSAGFTRGWTPFATDATAPEIAASGGCDEGKSAIAGG